MEFDVEAHLESVERSVAYTERDGIPASAVTLSRSVDATIQDLWEAATDPERIPQWFLPVEGDLRLGGGYQLEGNAGGSIATCDPLSSFSLTWEFAGNVSWVEVNTSVLAPAKARLTLSHTAHLSEHWDQYGAGAVGVGWELAFLGLTLYLEQPGWSKPDPEAFAVSQDGKAYTVGSSDGWRQASVDAGTDPEAAAAAASRTTAFYTGLPEEPA